MAMIRDDFCVLILTHGRASYCKTQRTLRNSGYTGPIYFVIDDEDEQGDDYRARFGDEWVVEFSKAEAADLFDAGDNLDDRRAVVYARNAAWQIVRDLGFRFFIVLDDDYRFFEFMYGPDHEWERTLVTTQMDGVLNAMAAFVEHTPCDCLAMSQTGEWIGGYAGKPVPFFRRKVMNSFVCDVERPFSFVGRLNEDVNTYVTQAHLGRLFLTTFFVNLKQADTQRNAGGLTDIYESLGTYVKSFYSVMMSPSSVRIGVLVNWSEGGDINPRIHHDIDWRRTAVQILREQHRRT